VSDRIGQLNEHGRPAWGALPRKTKFGALAGVPPFREVIEVIPQRDWPDLLPNHRGLDWCVGSVYDQDGVGSCASESSTQGVAVLRVFAGSDWIEFNPWFVYHTVSGGVDRGSSLDDNVAFLTEHGACPESVWPRSKGWRATPSQAAYDAARAFRLVEVFDIGSVDELGTALLKGFPVYYGSNAHAKLFTRMLDPETGRYINSWAESWGDQGFGTERFRSVEINYGAFAFRCARDEGENLPAAA
jgi:hypothetical protein